MGDTIFGGTNLGGNPGLRESWFPGKSCVIMSHF